MWLEFLSVGFSTTEGQNSSFDFPEKKYPHKDVIRVGYVWRVQNSLSPSFFFLGNSQYIFYITLVFLVSF